jgi:hypothetical protein
LSSNLSIKMGPHMVMFPLGVLLTFSFNFKVIKHVYVGAKHCLSCWCSTQMVQVEMVW